MPVIVLTTITPPPPPPTGLGGLLWIPAGYFNQGLQGSLRAPEDDTVNYTGSPAVGFPPAYHNIDTAGSLRLNNDVSGDITANGGNLVGSPNLGDV